MTENVCNYKGRG